MEYFIQKFFYKEGVLSWTTHHRFEQFHVIKFVFTYTLCIGNILYTDCGLYENCVPEL